MLKRLAQLLAKTAVASLAVAAPALVQPGGAAAQEGSQDQSAVQALLARQDTAVSAIDTLAMATSAVFLPTNSTYMRASENDVGLGSALNVVYGPLSGWLLTNALMVEQRRYRARDMTDVTENLLSQAVRVSPGVYTASLGVGNAYSKKKTLGLGRYGKDIIYDNETASGAFTLSRPQLGATESRLGVTAEARRGTNDFKYDRSVKGGLGGSVLYTIGDLVSAGAGFGTSRRVESSEVGDTTFSRMPTTADTIQASLAWGSGDKKLVTARYRRSVGIERKVMPPLGNSLEIIDDPSAAQEEEARIRQEGVEVQSSLAPFSFLTFDLTFNHALDDQQFRFDNRRSGKRENDDIRANVGYRYARTGTLRIGVSTIESSNDYGGRSLSSYDQREYSLTAGLTQELLDSLQLTLNGSGRLQQLFYKEKELNPRDVDRLHYRADGSIRARVFKRVSVDVNGAVERYETINIDATLSGDNRVDYLYRLGPVIRLKPARWINLAQDYTLKIEFTDFTFNEDKNYLNRTTTVNTKAEMAPFRGTAFLFRHTYMFKDTGSYLRRDGRDVYSPNSMNVEHTLYFDLKYAIMADLAIKAVADFRNQENGTYGLKQGKRAIVRTVEYSSGGLRLGFERKKQIGRYGEIDLDIAWVRNYGAFITEERKEFWAVDSAVNLKF